MLGSISFWRLCALVAMMAGLGTAAEPATSSYARLSDSKNADFESKTVTRTNGEPVGTLHDVIIDWNKGQPEFGVVLLFDNIHPDAGFTAVPWSTLRFGADSSRVQILATKEQLRKAPKVASTQGMANPKFLAEARRHFASQGSADSGMSGTVQGSGSSLGNERATGGEYLNAGSRGASVAVYVALALIIGIVVGRYLLARRRPARATG
jgi:hypothetical protein